MALTIQFPDVNHRPNVDLRPNIDDRAERLPLARLQQAGTGRTLLAATVLAAALSVGALGWGVVTPGSTPGIVESSGVNVVVRPGDTYWSIAEESMGHLERRSAVADLTALNGPSSELRVGDVVAIPASE